MAGRFESFDSHQDFAVLLTDFSVSKRGGAGIELEIDAALDLRGVSTFALNLRSALPAVLRDFAEEGLAVCLSDFRLLFEDCDFADFWPVFFEESDLLVSFLTTEGAADDVAGGLFADRGARLRQTGQRLAHRSAHWNLHQSDLHSECEAQSRKQSPRHFLM